MIATSTIGCLFSSVPFRTCLAVGGQHQRKTFKVAIEKDPLQAILALLKAAPYTPPNTPSRANGIISSQWKSLSYVTSKSTILPLPKGSRRRRVTAATIAHTKLRKSTFGGKKYLVMFECEPHPILRMKPNLRDLFQAEEDAANWSTERYGHTCCASSRKHLPTLGFVSIEFGEEARNDVADARGYHRKISQLSRADNRSRRTNVYERSFLLFTSAAVKQYSGKTVPCQD